MRVVNSLSSKCKTYDRQTPDGGQTDITPPPPKHVFDTQ